VKQFMLNEKKILLNWKIHKKNYLSNLTHVSFINAIHETKSIMIHCQNKLTVVPILSNVPYSYKQEISEKVSRIECIRQVKSIKFGTSHKQ
jgi:hypothetical protein